MSKDPAKRHLSAYSEATTGIEPVERSAGDLTAKPRRMQGKDGAAPRLRPAPDTEGMAPMQDQDMPRIVSLREALETEANRAGKPSEGDCFYCGYFSLELEYDHFPLPYKFGGTTVVPACPRCHTLKDRKPLEDWPMDMMLAAFEGLTPFAAMLVSKCLKLGFEASPDALIREPRNGSTIPPEASRPLTRLEAT
jgi:hypothetical protein